MSYTRRRRISHNLWQNWSGSRGDTTDSSLTSVRYVLDQVAMPIGVSNYELSQALPNELKSDLPSIEELEAELDGAESSGGGEAGEGS